MSLSDVSIWWIGSGAGDDRLLDAVASAAEKAFQLRVRRYHHADRPVEAFDVRRGQHSSTQILKWLVARPVPGGRTLAITDVDLFIPVLTFVYGEAQLGGTAAVVSTSRLGVEPGMPGAPALFVERVVKECNHELGHTFGLIHCDTAGCVMARSVNLIDVDAKGVSLCGECGAHLATLRQKDGHHHEQGTHAHPRRGR
jgi:archaemetzincin